jgi:hypothetical protein
MWRIGSAAGVWIEVQSENFKYIRLEQEDLLNFFKLVFWNRNSLQKLEPNNTGIKPCFTLGARANIQPKPSIPIGAKSWNRPQGLYTRSQDWNGKNIFQSTPSY